MSRNRHNATRPAKRVVADETRTTTWAKLNRSPLNKTRIAPKSPLSVSATERASLPSIITTATSPGVIHFHKRVFDARLHFYERLFRDFRTFMSEFEMNRPRLTSHLLMLVAFNRCRERNPHHRPARRNAALPVRGANTRSAGPKARSAASSMGARP